jgi:hypothetical protein
LEVACDQLSNDGERGDDLVYKLMGASSVGNFQAQL